MAYGTPPAQPVEAWLDAGLAAHHGGDLERALSAYRQVLSVQPDHPAALNLAGTALLQAGQPAAAVAYLEHAARRARNDANLLGNLGQAYLALRRYAEAADVFRKASRIDPRAARFQVGVAAALALQGKIADAETLLSRLSARFPREPLVWLNLGNVLRDTRRFEAALHAYRTAFALEPRMIEARNGAGGMLHSLMRFEEAEAEYRACMQSAPDDLTAPYNLASLCNDRGRYADAERICRDALERAPGDARWHLLLGATLAHRRRLYDAVECYAQAGALAPDDPDVARTYGGALAELGRFLEGLRLLARAAALEPESAPLERVLAGALLSEGRLDDAWPSFAARSGAAELRAAHRAWRPGEPFRCDGANVAVLPEQGLGDELFFLRYAVTLADRGARVSVCCSPRLATLLRRVPTFDPVVTTPAELPQDAEVRVLGGDLPLALSASPKSALPASSGRISVARFGDFAHAIGCFWPAPAPTLRIEPIAARVDALRERLGALGPAPYIGVTWRGGVAPEQQQAWSVLYKSLEPDRLARALRGVPGTFVALQRAPAPGELAAFSAALGRPLHDFTALNEDLEAMLALLAVLDDYVGVSNTNMHLRAAAGRTARVLVPAPPEWRWMRRGARSPWFPGFRVYRQSLHGNWSPALAALRSDLEVNYCRPGVSNHA